MQVSQDSEQREATFNITSGVKQPKHVFVDLQRTVRSSNQEHNPHILDKFKVNADNNDCYLSAARLEVRNGVYYQELEYSESDKVRIYMLSTISINKMTRIQDHYQPEIILTSSLDFFTSV